MANTENLWSGQCVVERRQDGKIVLLISGLELPLGVGGFAAQGGGTFAAQGIGSFATQGIGAFAPQGVGAYAAQGGGISAAQGGGLIDPASGLASAFAPTFAPTFAWYANGWLESVHGMVKESSYMKYWNMVNSYIIPELGEVAWNTLTREQVEAFCKKMLMVGGKKRTGLSPRVVSDTMSVIRRIFRYASDHGVAAPFDISAIRIKKEIKRLKVMSMKEMVRLYWHLRSNPTERNIGLLICMFMGLRLGEICALKWEDISFSEQTIHVHRTMQRIQTKDDPNRKTKIVVTPPKSVSSIRRIPIPPELARILSQHQKDGDCYVLTGRSDAFVEPRGMERHLDRILKSQGMEHINFHTLRHTFATRCVEMGFDVKTLSDILGHANVNVTLSRYVHPTMEMMQKGMAKVSLLMGEGMGEGTGKCLDAAGSDAASQNAAS